MDQDEYLSKLHILNGTVALIVTTALEAVENMESQALRFMDQLVEDREQATKDAPGQFEEYINLRRSIYEDLVSVIKEVKALEPPPQFRKEFLKSSIESWECARQTFLEELEELEEYRGDKAILFYEDIALQGTAEANLAPKKDIPNNVIRLSQYKGEGPLSN